MCPCRSVEFDNGIGKKAENVMSSLLYAACALGRSDVVFPAETRRGEIIKYKTVSYWVWILSAIPLSQ